MHFLRTLLLMVLFCATLIPLAVGAAAPKVLSVDSPTGNGYHKENATTPIQIGVTFDYSVTLAGGTPLLTLNSGGTATYVSGSPGTTLLFNYYVRDGENIADLDYAGTTSLSLGGGTLVLTSDGTTAASLTLPTPGSEYSLGGMRDIVVDTVRPTAASTLTASDNVTLQITFSEAVDETLAETVGNYTLSGTGGMSGNPSAVVLDVTKTVATLTVATMANVAAGKTVIVTIAGTLTDLSGNTISNLARNSSLTIDRVPEAFAFSTATNVALNTAVGSGTVTLAGMDAPAAVTVSADAGGTLKCAVLPVGTSTWSAFAGCTSYTVNAGDQIKLQVTTPATYTTPYLTGTIGIGGVTGSFRVELAAPVILPGNVTVVVPTALSAVLVDPASTLYLSSNGVVVVPATVSAPLTLLPSAAVNTVFAVKDGATATFAPSGTSRTLKPGGADVLAQLKSFAVDDYTGLQTLELISGRTRVAGAAGVVPLASVRLGTGTALKQLAVMSAGTGEVTVDVLMRADGTAAIGVIGGKASLRLAASASTVLRADAGTTLNANQVAEIDATGKVTRIRTGTIDDASPAQPDGVPDAYTFATVKNAGTGTAVESAAVTLAGINIPVAVTVSANAGGTLKCAVLPVGTSTWSAFADCTSYTVNAGDQIKLQVTTPATYTTPYLTGTIGIGGVTGSFRVELAAPVTVPGNVTVVAPTALSAVLVDPASDLYLSSNGVVVVPATVSAPLTLLPSAAANTVFAVKDGATATFALSGTSRTLKPGGADVLAQLKNFAVDDYSGLQTLELISGRTQVGGAAGIVPLASVRVGTGAALKQLAIMSAGTADVAVDVLMRADGTAAIGVTGGKASLRLAASASTVPLTVAGTTLLANEVAEINALGVLTKIRLGSLDGTAGVVGDPLSSLVTPSGVRNLAKIPNLGAAHPRIAEGLTLLQSVLDSVGPRASLSQQKQTKYGAIPMTLDGAPLYLIPVGDVLVDSTCADGVVLGTNGRFEVCRSGVKIGLTSTVADLGAFSRIIADAFSGTVTVQENGAVEILENGNTLMMRPDLFPEISGAADGLSVGDDGTLLFSMNGISQKLYPHFLDLSQLATAFASLGTIVSRDNMDGTATATVGNTVYTLKPAYEVLSSIGGVPPAHSKDAWWSGDDGLIYVKYTNGSAQGFALE